ncbi:hypothetical protein TNCV_1348201 [Trichonephila clavipes]|nr:hypothetical protein TNCV_1348201 [Trichonephila clavipes]
MSSPKRPPIGVVLKLEEAAQAQVSSTSLDHALDIYKLEYAGIEQRKIHVLSDTRDSDNKNNLFKLLVWDQLKTIGNEKYP